MMEKPISDHLELPFNFMKYLIPSPKSIIKRDDFVDFSKFDKIIYDNQTNFDNSYLDFFKNDLELITSKNYSIIQSKSEGGIKSNGVILKLDKNLNLNGYEGYELIIKKENIIISATGFSGIHNGIQTLIQIVKLIKFTLGSSPLSDINIPQCEIKDWSSFKFRGFMHDVGRNFQTIESLKNQMKIFSQYKINLFHWHLTDNPAWRIESKIYPQLNYPEFQRKTRDPGKYYTYNEIREFIRYCQSLNILVIPEIDIPGHSKYFKKSMGCFMYSKKGREYLANLFNEFFEEIPRKLAPYIHIGSDEVHIPFPKNFIKKFTKLVKKNNRDVLMWNPGLSIPSSGIAQLWSKPKNIKQNQKMVDSRRLYLNNCDPLSFILEILTINPCFKIQGDDSALGAILCLWPDVNVDNKIMIEKTNPIYSSIMALSEVCWKGREKLFNGDPMKIVDLTEKAFTDFSNFEDRILIHRGLFFKDLSFHYIKQRDIKWKLIGTFNHHRNYTESFPVEEKIKEKYELNGDTFTWRKAIGGTINLKDRFGKGGHYKDSELGTVYALTYIKSEISQKIKVWIGFEMVCRSNRQYRGIPAMSEWDPNGGMIWINNIKLKGPNWNNPNSFDNHKKATWKTEENERPYVEEEFYWLRSPTEISLNEGWNKVLIRVPYTYKSQNWQFTFIPVKKEGHLYVENNDLMFSNDLKNEQRA